MKKLEVVKVEITTAPKNFEHISEDDAQKAYDDLISEPSSNEFDCMSEDEAITHYLSTCIN